MAALPENYPAGENEAGITQEQLRDIFTHMARHPPPVGSLHRLWTIGELSAQVAWAYLSLWMRQWFADADHQKRRLMETNLSVALKLLQRLGYLRGAMAKVGQALGSLPSIVPHEIADVLDRLHFDAPPMHFSLLREMMTNELGQEPEELFASFERNSFAAASLGQVHRARLKTGELVAVKIQYPGIARTIDADFRNLSALLFPVRLGKDWESLNAQFRHIHQMLKMEADYEREAENLRRARPLFAAEDGIVVPRLYEHLSTSRVLTTEYLPGRHLPDFLAGTPPQALRDEFGAKMFLAWYRMYYAAISYADPHSGNYVFMDDGRLGLLDFGCVQQYGRDERELARLFEAVLEDSAALPALLQRGFGATEADLKNPEYMHLMGGVFEWAREPVIHEGPFDFGDEDHLKRGMEWVALALRRRVLRSHPVYFYENRSMFGLKALLLRLQARVDVRALHMRESARRPPA
jgi:predicted unusual protein kinase regulating ubiquinone biosynthesis (AarF/ABC1/UbiB family)